MESEHFEWNDAKAEANFRRHKVRFEHAVEAYKDPFALIELDDSEDDGEDRFMLIGWAAECGSWLRAPRTGGLVQSHCLVSDNAARDAGRQRD